MNNSRVNVLTYNQPHRKTQDLLLRLKVKGYEDINVLATPWVERKNYTPLIPHRNFPSLKITPRDLCQKIGYGFNEIELRDLNEIEGRILIGGAGILPKEVIDKRQIINSHPAYLPYVRGLDALKWAVYQGKPIGVTTHVISEECDAGQLINQKLVPLYAWDTFHSVAQRQYEMEIDLLVDSIEDIKTARLEELLTSYSPVMKRMSHLGETRLMSKFQNMIDRVQI